MCVACSFAQGLFVYFVYFLGCLGFFKDVSLKYFLFLNTIVSQPAEEMLTSCKRKEGGNEEVEEDSWSS